MSKKPRTLGAYADISGVLDVVLNLREVFMDFPDAGAAINFRQRAYRFRQMLLRKAEEDIEKQIENGHLPPGTFASTPYDSVFIQIMEDPTTLRFTLIDREKHFSSLRTADGTPIEIDSADEFEEEARTLSTKLGLQ